MVKSYLRYEPTAVVGIVTSPSSSPACVSDLSGKIVLSAACENVVLWDWKKGHQISLWKGEKAEVTSLARSPEGSSYAVGYADGAIRIWSIKTNTYTTVFNGHKGAVTALAFDKQGARLASGSKDTEVIVWDIIAESGLFRLRGHKDAITDLKFLEAGDQLITASKDSLVKLWDLQTQHCVETLVGHRSEVWSLDVSPDETLLITGSADKELRLWNINKDLLGKQLEDVVEKDQEPTKAISLFGPYTRQGTERVLTIKFNEQGTHFVCQSAEKIVEVFRVRSQKEIKSKLEKRERRKKQKAKQKGEQVEEDDDAEGDQVTSDLLVTPVATIRPPAKVKSVAYLSANESDKAFKLLVALHNNTIEVYSIDHTAKPVDVSQTSSLELPGHRSDVRTVAVSSDDQIFLSASNNSVKIWNVKSRACIRTMSSGYALCSAFTPGNRQVLIGTKTGEIEIFDVASSSMIRSIKAHSGAVWSLDISPDGKQLVTGSADHDVKFWDFDLARDDDDEDGTTPLRLTLTPTRTLRMSDDVLCVKFSPDQRLLAVSLLDATVKVFYTDTLKFFLSLYGHKLPVMALDISSDSTMIVTGSADKNVKIWGLDFGDCHKSIFAHDDSIMAVKFVPNTHYFFSASKDKTLKYWDGDKFENITKLEGHHAEVWCLAISKDGGVLVSGSHDRSIRIWERTAEQLFIEEEREKELEGVMEEDLVTENDKERTSKDKEETDIAGKKTLETIKAGEKLVEALELADVEKQKYSEFEEAKAALSKTRPQEASKLAPPPMHPLLAALGKLTPARYVLHVVREIRASELDQALLVLPFAHVFSLFHYLEEWVRNGWQIELTCRVLFFLLRVHQNQIVSNRSFRPMLDSIKVHIRTLIQRQKDMVGLNLAAMKFLKREWEEANTAEFYDISKIEEANNKPKKGKKRKVVVS